MLDFADIDQHPGHWIDRASKGKIGDVIAASAVARLGFRPERDEVLVFGPARDKQTARCGKLEAFADRQKHDATNILQIIVQYPGLITLTSILSLRERRTRSAW